MSYGSVCFCIRTVSGDALVALMFSGETALTQSLALPPTLDF